MENIMVSAWPMVPLGSVIRQRKEFIEIDDFETYKRCRVQLHAKGIVLRDLIEGYGLKTKKQQVCRPGELLVAEIDAKVGGFGIVPEELDGAIVSSHYFLFVVDETALDRRFLGYFIRTPDFQDQVSAQGSTNYASIRPQQVLDYEVPLPLLAEQRRIVARIEELAAKVEAAQKLRQWATQESELLMMQVCSQLLGDERWETRRLENILAEKPRNGLSPQRKVEQGGRPMLRISAVSSSPTRFVDLTAHVLVDVSDDKAQPFILQHDDVFLVRYNADMNRVAKAAIHKSVGDYDVVYPDKLIRLRVDRKEMTPDFLVYTLGSHKVRDQIEGLAKTTAGQIGISGTNVKSLRIPVPPISEQCRIVAYLDDLQAKVDSVKGHQAATAAALDALLPSILDRAFKGEL